MAVYKVEICGVNTSKLPILKEEEKKNCLNESKPAILLQEKLILRETYGLF